MKMLNMPKRDERITLHFQTQDELDIFLKKLPPRAKYEIIPYDGLGKYLKITKYAYLKSRKT